MTYLTKFDSFSSANLLISKKAQFNQMGMNITEKILARASGKTILSPDDVVFVHVDKVMVHDVSGPGVIAVFEKLKKQAIAAKQAITNAKRQVTEAKLKGKQQAELARREAISLERRKSAIRERRSLKTSEGINFA